MPTTKELTEMLDRATESAKIVESRLKDPGTYEPPDFVPEDVLNAVSATIRKFADALEMKPQDRDKVVTDALNDLVEGKVQWKYDPDGKLLLRRVSGWYENDRDRSAMINGIKTLREVAKIVGTAPEPNDDLELVQSVIAGK